MIARERVEFEEGGCCEGEGAGERAGHGGGGVSDTRAARGAALLMQPGILLYDRLVMNAAASEACRLLATKTDAAGDMAESCEAFVRRRLGAVPPVSCFHVHEGGCSWEVRLEGDEGSDEVRVSIVNEARPLPLIGVGGRCSAS